KSGSAVSRVSLLMSVEMFILMTLLSARRNLKLDQGMAGFKVLACRMAMIKEETAGHAGTRGRYDAHA
ncbi:MAG: hypothetical protein WAK92_01225, partial [Thiobacillus sp.]